MISRLIRQTSFAAIDFESAGTTRGSTDQPIQVGLACWNLADGVTDTFCSYIHTDQAVLWSAQKVHGISTADLKDAPSMHELWPEFRRRLEGSVVVAHGKGTEKRFLRAFPGHGFGPWLDTLILSRAIWPELPSHALSELSQSLGIVEDISQKVPGKSWHDALFDSVASLLVLGKAVEVLNMQDGELDAFLRPNTGMWHRIRAL